MSAKITEWTAELARRLPDDGNRYEVLDGALFVTPVPSKPHQRAAGALFLLLAPYTRDNAIGETWFAPADLEFNPRRLLQPDLFVVSLVDGKRTMNDQEMPRRLLLAVEVLSPSTRRADRVTKRAIYMDEGVSEYWIVDVDARLFEIWRPGDDRPAIVGEEQTWRPVESLPGFTLELPAFFEGLID